MRKFAWAAFSFAFGICLSHYIISETYIWLVIGSLMVVGLLGAVLLRKNMRTRVILACIFTVLGIFRYEVQVHTKLDGCRDYIGDVNAISAVVTDYPDVYDTSVRLTVKLLSNDIPNVKAQFYDYSKETVNLVPGDLIEGTVKFNSAEMRYGDDSDTYISKGIYLRGYFKEEPTYHGRSVNSWIYAPARLGQQIRETLDDHISEGAAAFVKALLTGDKTGLYNQPERYYRLTRAGISHVVAVSGMHVGFLVGLVMILFGNRRGWIFGIASIILFAVMTGLSPSVIRAVLMQMLFLIAPILRREPDGLTSISFALFLILLLNPFTIASVSLQLSFAAMLGIVLLTPRMLLWFQKRYSVTGAVGKRLYDFATASFATSLGATAFTAPLCAYYFGSICVFSPLTNLLVLWIVPVCFALGLLICVVAPFTSFIAACIGKILELAVGFVYLVAETISAIPIASVYLPGMLMFVWFFLSYFLIAFTYMRRGKELYRPMQPFAVCTISLLLLVGVVFLANRQNCTVAAVDVGQGQSVVINRKGETIVVDCGGEYDAGDRVAKWLYTHGCYNVDGLYLTHFDEDHINGVISLMSQVPVSQLVIASEHINQEQRLSYENILKYADIYQVNVIDLSENANYQYGEITVRAFVSEGTGNNEGLIVLSSIGDYDVLVTGDADVGTENDIVRSGDLPDGELLVVGHHGSKYSTGKKLLESFKPEYAIISVGYNNYGHPSQEVLDRLSEKSVVLYRTDEHGNIEIKVR